MQYTSSSSQPITLSASVQSRVYGLFTLAMGLTLVGIYGGIMYAETLMQSGLLFALTIVELGLVFSARMWMEKYPLNYVLFGLFPLLSGITVTPYLLSIMVNFQNGSELLLNASIATIFMALAAALFARIGPNLAPIAKALFIGLIGILILSVLQIFVPSLRTQTFELAISGVGILIFAGFTAYDLQRISKQAQLGANPFLLALSLYLDIFNLFLMILRFMTALSGDRR